MGQRDTGRTFILEVLECFFLRVDLYSNLIHHVFHAIVSFSRGLEDHIQIMFLREKDHLFCSHLSLFFEVYFIPSEAQNAVFRRLCPQVFYPPGAFFECLSGSDIEYNDSRDRVAEINACH